MKKEGLYVALYFVVITFIASLVTSCATGHAGCDAYGQANYSQNQDVASK